MLRLVSSVCGHLRVRHRAQVCVCLSLAVLLLGVGGRASAQDGPPAPFPQLARTFHDAVPQGLTVVRDAPPDVERALRRKVAIWPVNTLTVIAEGPDDVTWVGTPRGLVRLRADGTRQFFASLRWLPDDHVLGIAAERGGAWVLTPKGVAHIVDRPMTLPEKSQLFVDRIQARHVRWGLTASSRLRTPGDVATNQMVSSDNDGLWTAIYVAAESYRFAVTGADDARQHARTGLRALLRLESITGRSGFPARSFIRKGVDLQPSDGEWHDTADGEWRWKGDTSSDEIVGHYFVFPIYYELVANDEEKALISGYIDRLTTHILDNGYHLVDTDGKPTRWGWWAPDEIWADPDETGLRALHMLSHLRVAIALAGTPAHRARYEAAYADLIRTHRYHLLTRNQKVTIPGSVNHSDDQLAFLSYYPLLRYERDAELREVYAQSLERAWLIERPERNPLWNVIYAVGSGASDADREASVRTLREIPLDTIDWSMDNTHRLDLPQDPIADRKGERQALVVASYAELPMKKWNHNPYGLSRDQGGRSEDDGAYFLLPYWMGRYHRVLEP